MPITLATTSLSATFIWQPYVSISSFFIFASGAHAPIFAAKIMLFCENRDYLPNKYAYLPTYIIK